MKNNSDAFKKKSLLPLHYVKLILIVVSLVLALLLRWLFRDFKSIDYQIFISHWYDFIKSHGGFRALKYDFANYTPPYLYLLTLATYFPLPKLYAIKIISMAFDPILALTVYCAVKNKYQPSILPVLSFIAVLFAPTVILNSALWGQCDAIFTSALLASLYFLLQKKNLSAMLFYSLAFSFKLQAVFLLPVFIIVALKKEFPVKYFWLIPGVYFLCILPSLFFGGSLTNLLFIYGGQSHLYANFLTLNAPNLYQWLPANPQLFGKAGLIFGALVILAYMYVIYKSNQPLTNHHLIKIALTSTLLVPFVLPQMHERYFFPADLISIIYAFYFPKYFWLPIVVISASLFSYFPFLFQITVINLVYLAIMLAAVLVIVLVDLMKDLYDNPLRLS
jgi:Gpi18-like mannosyltransferase